jgi:hypothetical protein
VAVQQVAQLSKIVADWLRDTSLSGVPPSPQSTADATIWPLTRTVRFDTVCSVGFLRSEKRRPAAEYETYPGDPHRGASRA